MTLPYLLANRVIATLLVRQLRPIFYRKMFKIL